MKNQHSTNNKHKERLDKVIVAKGLVLSRELAQSLILRGDVLVDDVPITKAGQLVRTDSEIRLRTELSRFVSRGGEKLEGALEDFNIDVSELVILDLGASTGGFTDCLLQRGAKKIYAVDVGRAQLAEKLRQDPRVAVFEEFHAKLLNRELFDPLPSFATVDVSFIGLRKVLPYVFEVLSSQSLPWKIVALVKPQFELGPEYVKKGGVVPSEEDRLLAVQQVREFVEGAGYKVAGTVPSRIKGSKSGNQEYFVYLTS